MRSLKYILLLPVAMIMLVAASCDERVQKVAVATCNGLSVAYAHYDEIKASGILSVRYTAPVDAIRVQTDKACVSPSTLSTVRLAGLAAQAYVALRPAFQAALGQGDRDYDATKGLEIIERLKADIDRLRRTK